MTTTEGTGLSETSVAFQDPLQGPTAVNQDEPDGQLSRKVRGSLKWSLVNAGSARLLSVLSGMVIARLVTPSQYGVYAIGFLVLAAITSMNELGVSVAVQRWPTDPREVAPTACTIAIATSVAIYVVIFFSAPVLASALGSPAATTVIQLIGLNAVLDGFSSIPNALLSRSFLQGRRTVVDLIAFVPAAVLSITLAAAGKGAIGLVVGSLAGNLAAVIAIYVVSPSRPRPAWNRQHARMLVRGGLPFAATSAVYLATLNVDYVVVGRVLGVTALGLYLLAFNLSSWPPNLISFAVRRVAIPGFAQIADDRPTLNRVFARSLHLVAAASVLIAVLMGTLAQPLIRIFYGPQWSGAVEALRWLAILGGIRVVLDLCYDVLVGLNRGKALLYAQLIWLVGLIVALPIAARLGGIRGVGIGHVIVACGLVAPVYALTLRRSGLSLKSVGAALAGPLAIGAGLVVLILGGMQLAPGPWVRLAVLGSGGAALYIAAMSLLRQNRTELSRLLTQARAT